MNEVQQSSLSNSTTARRARSPITAVKLVLHTATQTKRRRNQMVHIQLIKTAKPASVSPVQAVLLREIRTQDRLRKSRLIAAPQRGREVVGRHKRKNLVAISQGCISICSGRTCRVSCKVWVRLIKCAAYEKTKVTGAPW